MTKKRSSWYDLLPWWGWFAAVIATSQIASRFLNHSKGALLTAFELCLGFLMIYSLAALFVKIVISIYRYIVRIIPRRKKPIPDDSKELLDFRE